MSVDRYEITKEDVPARPIAAVRARASLAELRRQIPALVGKVYEAADNDLTLDGQHVVVFRGTGAELDVDVGVGASGPFAPRGQVTYSETPAGTVAWTTHWGDYAQLPKAHAAVTRWCNAHECALAGPRWEVYGQWDDNPLRRRTDVYYLLK
jgi:effector-binding domain-containing protein